MIKSIVTAIALVITATSASANMGAVYQNGSYVGSINEVMISNGSTVAEADAAVSAFYAAQAVQRKKDRDQESRAAKRALVAAVVTPVYVEVEEVVAGEVVTKLVLSSEITEWADQDAVMNIFVSLEKALGNGDIAAARALNVGNYTFEGQSVAAVIDSVEADMNLWVNQ